MKARQSEKIKELLKEEPDARKILSGIMKNKKEWNNKTGIKIKLDGERKITVKHVV